MASGKVRIGYMGIPFSNSAAMAAFFAEKSGIEDPEFVALMSARETMDALVAGEVEYGVFATENKFAGTVIETQKAFDGHDDIEILSEDWTPIHHCVFVKNEGDRITKLVSHIQALMQSRNNLSVLYPDAEMQECEDTAYAAEMLAAGQLPEGSAAVCRRDAGEHYGLVLVNENVEDNKDNMTKFAFIKLG